jgi:hypothetical protein
MEGKTMKMTKEEKEARKEARRIERKRAAYFARVKWETNQKPVAEMTINIEWVKSRTWGANPRATAKIKHTDGTYSSVGPFTCSGCGYDKESTVIAEVFSAALSYKLYGRKRRGEAPYGIYYYNGKYQDKGDYLSLPMYNGGVGTSCYYDIAKFIGGKFERVASGTTFDAYKYTDKRRAGK